MEKYTLKNRLIIFVNGYYRFGVYLTDVRGVGIKNPILIEQFKSQVERQEYLVEQ